MMDNEEKIPLKKAKLSIDKFNDIFVPQYVQLLNNHTSNIEKFLKFSDWEKIKKEEINANRILKQLKNHLLEIDILRIKINSYEISKFDELTFNGRKHALNGVKQYLDLQRKAIALRQTAYSNNFNNIHENDDDDIDEQIQIKQIQSDFKPLAHKLKSQEALTVEFEHLYKEIEDIHELFHTFHSTVLEQREEINVIAENVDVVQLNVESGESNLRKALSYKKAMYPVCGAILGTCIGGPIGLIVGLKAGGLAAVGCGILGFTGGSVIKNKEKQEQPQQSVEKQL